MRADKRALRRFKVHQRNARSRGIEFLLTFAEWWYIWDSSGNYANCGRGKAKFCMARNNDAGSYSADNVRIITNAENQQELLANPIKLKEIGGGMRGKKHSKETRELFSRQRIGNQRLLGHKHSEETKLRLSERSKAAWNDPAFATRGSNVMLKLWQDPVFRAKQSEARKRAWENPERREAARRRMVENNPSKRKSS